MSVKNNGPGRIKIPKTATKYPSRAEIDLRMIAKHRLEDIRIAIKEDMPEIMAIISEENKGTSNADFRKDSDDDILRKIRNCFVGIRDRLNREWEGDSLERKIQQCADYTDQRQLSDWRKSVRSAIGLDIVDDYFVGRQYSGMLAEWVRQNVGFVTSIEEECLTDLEEVIIEGFTAGKSPKAIANRLQERFGASQSKAKSLARDQIGTLTAQLTQTRHQAAEVSEYYWDTSGDSNVRPCHAELDGKRFRYDNPPPMWYMTKAGKKYTGRHCNPGEDYGCRCIARPVFEFERINFAAFKEE